VFVFQPLRKTIAAMNWNRRYSWMYAILFAVWALVVAWQAEEHARVVAAGKNVLRRNANAVANTLGAFIRGLQFRGAVFSDRLEPALNELVSTNSSAPPGELISVVLLNAAGEAVAAAGKPVDLAQPAVLQQGERWGERTVTMVYPVFGARLVTEGDTNRPPPVVITSPFAEGRRFPRRDRHPGPPPDGTNLVAFADTNLPPPPQPPPHEEEGGPRPRRPFWARGMDEQEYQSVIQKRELHGLVITLSIESIQAVRRHDLWLRYVICFFAGVSAVGVGVAWRNLAKSSDLQIRLVRASELNTHLKEMNLAAAGLAHETRNPLNIIRGLAQMISKQPDLPPAIQEKSRTILDETDKVTAQLTEFINYSRPREIRRAMISLNAVANEVIRTLAVDLEEKKIRLDLKGDRFSIEADEQLLRQALFNLVLNATQSVATGGHIQIVMQRESSAEASVEVRDDGPGVPPENRAEIFKPYFTTQPKGTGLGLAVVQQIVASHGWEIQCLAHEPRGAVFRISHLKLVV
jgi:signal transduction histidine kinase